MHPTAQHEPTIRVLNMQPGDLVQFGEICRMDSVAADARDRVLRIAWFPGSPDAATRAPQELLDARRRSAVGPRKLLAQARTRIARH